MEQVILPGYVARQCIYESERHLIYRGHRDSDALPVIIKQLKEGYATARQIARLRLEFDIIKRLRLDGVVDALAYKSHKDRHALVFEDFGAESLERHLAAGSWAPPDSAPALAAFLRLAVALADTLARVHGAGFIHKDIKPHNVVFNAATGVVKLIDFGIASLLATETPQLTGPDVLEGTLAYVSPEQTGRMNRSVDCRSDLYSLGATFYELLAGRPPFLSASSLELVHSHIAKVPPPLAELNPAVPPPLCRLVAKLLAKAPEDRYQGAYGLKHDLVEMLRRLEAAADPAALAPFELARKDASTTFHPSAKLYGRARDIDRLLAHFDEVASGAAHSVLALVAGYSGIGKTSIINEVHKPLTHKRGYFIAGKFDQFKRNIPYASFVQAFQSLVRQILTEPDSSVQRWKARLARALRANGQVIVDVIPEIESILGPQPPLPALGAVENQNRFNRVFRDFCAVFCQPEHPLVIFLDDLQWADAPTLGLIEVMMTDPDVRHLMLIGAYRDNEVDERHALAKTLGSIKKTRPVHTIALGPLGLDCVTELVADSLFCPRERARPLAELVYQKTRGNPFFVKMILTSMSKEGALRFDVDAGEWSFDLARIGRMNTADNVVELMVRRLRQLPKETQDVLAVGATLSNQFSLRLLSLACEATPERAGRPLWPALNEGLLLPLGDEYKWMGHLDGGTPHARFKFLHDRVQQAAYALTPEAERAALHLRLGRLLREHLTEEERNEHAFEVADHLNRGRALVTDAAEARAIARLNLAVARRAKASSAYEPALSYVEAGLRCLPEGAWASDYELAFDLHLEKGELYYLTARYAESIATLDAARSRARTLLDRARVNALAMVSYRMENDLRTALQTGIAALAEFGVRLNPAMTHAELAEEIRRSREFIDGQDVEAYFDLPEMDDPEKMAVLRLLAECFTPAYFLGSRLLPMVGIRMSEICVRHGKNPLAPLAFVFLSAITLAFTQRDYENARRFGRLALRLNDEKYHVKASEAVILNMWGAFVAHYTGEMHVARDHLMTGYYSGLEHGAYQWAGYCAINCLFMDFWGVLPLAEVRSKVLDISPGLAKVDPNMVQYYYCIQATARSLVEERADPYHVSPDDWPDSDAVLARCREEDDLLTLFVDAVCKLSLANWLGDAGRALAFGEQAAGYEVGAPGIYINPAYHWHHALACAAACEGATEARRAEYLRKIDEGRALFRKWAATAPTTYEHQLWLIDAEVARVTGDAAAAQDAYDRAIGSADRNGFLANEAFANELAGRFHLRGGRKTVARAYLAQAVELYGRWGAGAKVGRLRAQYGELLDGPKRAAGPAAGAAPAAAHAATAATAGHTRSGGASDLDVEALLRATQALSREIVSEKLIERLLRIVMEHAGAQTVHLILESGGKLCVEARAWADTGSVELCSAPLDVDGAPPAAAAAASPVPLSVLKYVARLRHDVVLADAAQSEQFADDPAVAARQPKSVLCSPILHQGRLLGMIYLENNLAAGTFTAARLEFLRVLSSQVAISLENARFYALLEQRVNERTRELRAAQEQIVELQKERLESQMAGGFAHEVRNALTSASAVVRMLSADGRDAKGSVFERTGECLAQLLELVEPRLAPAEVEALHALVGSIAGNEQQLEEAFDLVRRCVGRGLKLTHEILAYARIGRQQRGDEPVQVETLIEHLVQEAQRGGESPVLINASVAEPAVLVGSELHFRTILQNIVKNAVDAAELAARQRGTRERVEVVARRDPDGATVWVDVADTGVGIEEEHLTKIFEPFFSTKPDSGVGLGLGMAQKLARLYGAKIEVKSSVGVGTKVSVGFPLERGAHGERYA